MDILQLQLRKKQYLMKLNTNEITYELTCDHKVLKQDSQKFPDRQGRIIFLLHCLIRNRVLQLPYFRNCERNNNKKEIEECTFPTSVLGIYKGPLQTTSGLLNDLFWTLCKSTLII